MTWLWFALIGIFALGMRKSISKWIGNWSDEALQRLAAGGLVAFGLMATLGLGLGLHIPWLHVAAGLGGVLGFFAMAEIANRRSGPQLAEMDRVRARVAQLREKQQREPATDVGSRPAHQAGQEPGAGGRRIPPLIKAGDSEQSILDILSSAAEQWEDPEVDIGAAAEPSEPPEPQHQTYQSVAQILKRANEDNVAVGPGSQAETGESRLAGPAAKPTQPVIAAREPKTPEAAKADLKPSAISEDIEPFSHETEVAEAWKTSEQAKELERDRKPAATGPAPIVAKPSTIDRESGPISLGGKIASEPTGPLSLSPKAAGPSSAAKDRANTASFVYQPQLVRSRLGGAGAAPQSVEPTGEPAGPKKPQPADPTSEAAGPEETQSNSDTPDGEPAADD